MKDKIKNIRQVMIDARTNISNVSYSIEDKLKDIGKLYFYNMKDVNKFLSEMLNRIEELESQLEWRFWPNDKPKCKCLYQVAWPESSSAGFDFEFFNYDGGNLWGDGQDYLDVEFYWRPIGDFPKKEKNDG